VTASSRSHTDTLRDYVMSSAGHTLTVGADKRHWDALTALDALLADLQRLEAENAMLKRSLELAVADLAALREEKP